jgi:hypothetical protein
LDYQSLALPKSVVAEAFAVKIISPLDANRFFLLAAGPNLLAARGSLQ